MKRGILGCLFLMLLAGCQPQNLKTSEPQNLEITDGYGRTVSVPAQAQRVVSLSPAVTEIVYALGAGERLVGRTDYCNYPEACLALPSVGGISNLNVEAIVALQPDLVISGSMVSKKNVEQLEKLGIPVVCFPEGKRFEDLYKNIEGIAQTLNVTPDTLLSACRDAIYRVSHPEARRDESRLYRGERPTLYYVVGYGKGGNFTAGGNTFISDIISLAGCRNIAEELEGWSYSQEALLEADPDYILIRKEDSAAFCSMPPYTRLTAVKEGRVIAIESGLIDQQSPRNVQAIKIIDQAVSRR